jgi:hypothetical protein
MADSQDRAPPSVWVVSSLPLQRPWIFETQSEQPTQHLLKLVVAPRSNAVVANLAPFESATSCWLSVAGVARQMAGVVPDFVNVPAANED